MPTRRHRPPSPRRSSKYMLRVPIPAHVAWGGAVQITGGPNSRRIANCLRVIGQDAGGSSESSNEDALNHAGAFIYRLYEPLVILVGTR